MMLAAPRFWWRRPGWQAPLLSPAALAYGAIAGRRMDHGEPAAAGVPVLCVGNFVLGGAGKTPTAIALAKVAADLGHNPGILSRGHGGSLKEPTLVDPARHDARFVGDEPMLLAAAAPTVVAADRAKGAAMLKAAGARLIVMDDGFQSARLAIDHALLVVDAGRGLGNGRVFPAGPLRAPLETQLRHADAVLLVGTGRAGDAAADLARQAGKPVFGARLMPAAPERWRGTRVLAFAGIADPRKFYGSLREIGVEIVATRDFPDHHVFTEAEAQALAAAAARQGLRLVTTRKDWVRLSALGGAARSLAENIAVLDVELAFEAAETAGRIIESAVEAFRRRLPE